MDDLLLSTSRVATTRPDARSVVVVGLPRSGSSLLSQLMSELPEWYVFDDLYLARAAKKAGVFDSSLSPKALDQLLVFLEWQIRARLRHGQYAIPNVGEYEIDQMNLALKRAFKDHPASWTDLQEDWLIRLASRAGATHWGYKMPGAFRHLDRLFKTYPRMKAVFLMRAPEAVLASYKHMPKTSEDGDPAQYHPVAHAVYWRMAARAFRGALRTYGPERVTLVRYEDMVRDPDRSLKDIATFLETAPPESVRLPDRSNSSFNGARRSLTGLEQSLVDRIVGTSRRDLGFAQPARVDWQMRDVQDFLRTSLSAGTYWSKKLVLRR